MRAALVALVLALVLLAPAVVAASARIDLEARDDGFHAAGEANANPTLHVEPGSHVVIAFVNHATKPENLRLGEPVNQATVFAQRPNESAGLVFDLPADFLGDVAYSSDADPSLHGRIHVGTIPPTIRIVTPTEKAEIAGSVATVNVAVTRWTGSIAYLVDAKKDATTTALSHSFGGLAPGPHLLRAELVDANGSALAPDVYDERLVTMKAPPTPPTASTPEPTPQPAPSKGIPALSVVQALAPALALALVTASRCRRR